MGKIVPIPSNSSQPMVSDEDLLKVLQLAAENLNSAELALRGLLGPLQEQSLLIAKAQAHSAQGQSLLLYAFVLAGAAD